MRANTSKMIKKMSVILTRKASKCLDDLSQADLGRFNSAINRIEMGHGGKMMRQAHGVFRGRITDSLRFIYLIQGNRIIVMHIGVHQESDRFVSLIGKQGLAQEHMDFD
jgi:mRNA-degrading endonuclease RelE of RelBE toxin-antitoxin system